MKTRGRPKDKAQREIEPVNNSTRGRGRPVGNTGVQWTPDLIAKLAREQRAGKSLRLLALSCGVTRERVRQVLQKAGYETAGYNAPNKLKSRRALREFTKKNNFSKRIEKAWSMTLEDYQSHVQAHGSPNLDMSPMNRFRQQRNSAHRNNIHWDLRFLEWWKLWCDSGVWNQRGLSAEQYVMGRFNWARGYITNNCEIRTHRENVSLFQTWNYSEGPASRR